MTEPVGDVRKGAWTGVVRKRSWAIAAAGVVVAAGVVAAIASGGREPLKITLPAGTEVVARLSASVTTETARVGDRVRLETRDSLPAGDGLSLPPGLAMAGEVTHAKGGGRVAGAPELTIRVTSLAIGGDEHSIGAIPFRFRGRDDAKRSALAIAGGAVAGAVLGEVVADRAIEGAVIGAAAGTAIAIATKGDQIVLPAGTSLRVRLTEPVTVEYRPPRSAPGSR